MLLVDIVTLFNQSDGTQKQARKTILNTILSYYVDWSEVVPVVSLKYNSNRGIFLLLLFLVLFFCHRIIITDTQLIALYFKNCSIHIIFHFC